MEPTKTEPTSNINIGSVSGANNQVGGTENRQSGSSKPFISPTPAQSKQITSHRVNGLNEALNIEATDEPGPGNAHHKYDISWGKGFAVDIAFQNGPIKENGVNGISNEALLAVVEHRLVGFQAGPYACRDNAVALTKIQEAMMWLHRRTNERIQRGVEGTSIK